MKTHLLNISIILTLLIGIVPTARTAAQPNTQGDPAASAVAASAVATSAVAASAVAASAVAASAVAASAVAASAAPIQNIEIPDEPPEPQATPYSVPGDPLGPPHTISSSVTSEPQILQNAIQIVARGYRTCALTAEGRILCWGHRRRVGLWSTPEDFTEQVSNGSASAIGLGSDYYRVCASNDHNNVQCQDMPAVNILDPVAVTTGKDYACALNNEGGVACWGLNEWGQLGNGTTQGSDVPVNVHGLESNVQAIAAGGRHTCALTNAGHVQCWGYNADGQLGDGTTENRNIPVDVSELDDGIIAIGAGSRGTCAVTSDGRVKCWGDVLYLAPGNTVTTPVEVPGLTGATAIDLFWRHACVLIDEGRVKCWGENDYGEAGIDPPTSVVTTPVEVPGLTGATGLALGYSHSCALVEGRVKCWGSNAYGELGNGSYDYSGANPTDVCLYPVLSTSPGSISIQTSQAVSTTSSPYIISVKNTGSLPLTISDIDIGDSYAQINSCPLSPHTLAVNTSCEIAVTFTPRSVGTHRADLIITSDGTPFDYERTSLEGTAVPEQSAETVWKGGSRWGVSYDKISDVSFTIFPPSQTWGDFRLYYCDGWHEIPIKGYWCDADASGFASGPGAIIDNQVSYSSDTFSFTGHFVSPTLITGIFTLEGYSGPWTASQILVPQPSSIDPQSGGSVTAEDSSVHITFPEGSVATPTQITITTATTAPFPLAGFRWVGRAASIVATGENRENVKQFSQPFTMEIRYTEADWQNAGIQDERDMSIYYWNGTAWEGLLPCSGCAHDLVGNKFTIVLDHLSDFALLSDKELYLDKQASPADNVRDGDTLTYTLTMSGTDLNVRLWDPLPQLIRYVPGSLTGTVTPAAVYSPTAHAIIWDGALLTGTVETIRFQVTRGITGTGSLMLAPPIANTAWLTNTENEHRISSTAIVNGRHVYVPLMLRDSE